MKTLTQYFLTPLILLTLAACSGSSLKDDVINDAQSSAPQELTVFFTHHDQDGNEITRDADGHKNFSVDGYQISLEQSQIRGNLLAGAFHQHAGPVHGESGGDHQH